MGKKIYNLLRPLATFAKRENTKESLNYPISDYNNENTGRVL
jgi:hypothetical protein